MNETIRVLYIDDYDLDRELVRDALEREHGGFIVTQASDRRSFETLFAAGTFDVILSDFNIAGFEGLQVLESVRRADPLIPVVIITGTGSEEIAVKAMKLGATDYVIKRPEQFRKLPQTLLAAIEKKTLRDQREKAEIALRRSETRYRTILENALVGIYQVTTEGRFVYANQKLLNMLGFTSFDDLSAFGGMPRLYARPEEREPIIREILDKGFIIKEVEFKRKDRTPLWVKLQTRKALDDDGRTIFEGLMEDITNVREIEVRLKEAQKLEAIATLAGGIAHDFNNILASIIGFAELSLDETEPGSVMADNLHEIHRAGERASELVKQIMTFSQHSDAEVTLIPVNKPIFDILRFIRATFPGTIRINQSIETGAHVLCNEGQLYQALMNLCTNAAQSMKEEGGILEINAREDYLSNTSPVKDLGLASGNYVRISVSDTGTGISPKIIGQIFEPYFTTKIPGVGTGMGLAQVHGIIEASGGKILVESAPGQGSVFTIYLPIVQNTGSTGTVAPEVIPKGSETILFVDDEPPMVKLGCKLLERLGYSVTGSTSALEALSLFRENPNAFDLVVTDIKMPKMSGSRFAELLVQIRPDLPVIFLTGYTKAVSGNLEISGVAMPVIHKPIDVTEMASTLRQVMDAEVRSAPGEEINTIDKEKR